MKLEKNITMDFVYKILIFIWVIVFALALRWTVMEIYIMPVQAMMPTIFENDNIIVNKLAYGLQVPFSSSKVIFWSKPKIGDIIIFRTPFNPKLISIRRVIGTPETRIFFEHGNLYVNEKKVQRYIPSSKIKDYSWLEDYDFSNSGLKEDITHYTHWEESLSDRTYSILLKKQHSMHLIFGPYRIPPGYYFVMADHRDRAQDSRTWPSQIKKAKGIVTFYRNNHPTPIIIPKGTLLRTNHPKLPEYFETLSAAHLEGESIEVLVQARKAGLSGNVQAGEINTIEGKFPWTLIVSNSKSFTSGEDQNLVHESDIIGRVSRVLINCKKTLPYLDSFCHPFAIRWSRTLLSLYE